MQNTTLVSTLEMLGFTEVDFGHSVCWQLIQPFNNTPFFGDIDVDIPDDTPIAIEYCSQNNVFQVCAVGDLFDEFCITPCDDQQIVQVIEFLTNNGVV
jgi:hypothetical protein